MTWSHAYDVDFAVNTATHLASDSHDATLMSGLFHGTLDLGGASYSTPKNPPCGKLYPHPTDGYLVKLDAGGGYAWSRHFHSGYGDVAIRDATFDPAGDVLAVGTFAQTITIDGVTYTTGSPSCVAATSGWGALAGGGVDSFVARFKIADGSLVWVKTFGGPMSDQADALTTVACGLRVGGMFETSIDFGSGPIMASNPNDPNRFLLDLTTDGEVISAAGVGSAGAGTWGGYALAPARSG